MIERFQRVPLNPSSLKPGVVANGHDLFAHARTLRSGQGKEFFQASLRVANALPISTSKTRKATATFEEAQALLKEVKSNPIAKNMAEYVPKGGCFAKAFVGHLLGLRKGYDKGAFLKLIKAWNGNSISHHVALGLRASDGGWWVIDPLQDSPKKLETWGDSATYLCKPNRWGPSGLDVEKYSREHFWRWTPDGQFTGKVDKNSPLYNDLMGDIRRYFKRTP